MLSTTQALLDANPTLANFKVRVDQKTQMASVIDVIRMVTGMPSKDASNYLKRVGDTVATRCRQLRINGKGRG